MNETNLAKHFSNPLIRFEYQETFWDCVYAKGNGTSVKNVGQENLAWWEPIFDSNISIICYTRKMWLHVSICFL